MNYNVPSHFQFQGAGQGRGAGAGRKSLTVNQYHTAEAIVALNDCLLKGLITDANYWAAELCVSGLHVPLWDTLIKFYFQHITYMNPQLIDYLNQKCLLMAQIKKLYSGGSGSGSGSGSGGSGLCNNQEVRNHTAEAVCLLCLADKTQLMIPDTPNQYQFDDEMTHKTGRMIQILVPYLSSHSVVYRQFHLFIMNYYVDDLDNCMYYIDWFIKHQDYTINPFEELKVPATVASKSLWLIWKFLLTQYQQ